MSSSIQDRFSSLQVSIDSTLNRLGIADDLERAQQTICSRDFAFSVVSNFGMGLAAGAVGGFVGKSVLNRLSPWILNRSLDTLTKLSLKGLWRMSSGELGVRLCAGMSSFLSNGLVFNTLSGHIEGKGVIRTTADMGICHFLNLFINPQIARAASPLLQTALQFLIGGAVFNGVSLSRETLERRFGTLENSEQHLLSQILINYAMHSGSMLGGHLQERFTSRFGEGIQTFFSKLAAKAEQALEPKLAIVGFEGLDFEESNLVFSEVTDDVSVVTPPQWPQSLTNETQTFFAGISAIKKLFAADGITLTRFFTTRERYGEITRNVILKAASFLNEAQKKVLLDRLNTKSEDVERFALGDIEALERISRRIEEFSGKSFSDSKEKKFLMFYAKLGEDIQDLSEFLDRAHPARSDLVETLNEVIRRLSSDEGVRSFV